MPFHGVGMDFFGTSAHYPGFYSQSTSPVLSISFEVDVPTGKVGGSLLFECRRRKLPRGVWGHAPPENFEIYML